MVEPFVLKRQVERSRLGTITAVAEGDMVVEEGTAVIVDMIVEDTVVEEDTAVTVEVGMIVEEAEEVTGIPIGDTTAIAVEEILIMTEMIVVEETMIETIGMVARTTTETIVVEETMIEMIVDLTVAGIMTGMTAIKLLLGMLLFD
jgi:hypothetical protein